MGLRRPNFTFFSNIGGHNNTITPPHFGRHVKPLLPVAFAVVYTHFSFKEG
jgi:hypothetical protein